MNFKTFPFSTSLGQCRPALVVWSMLLAASNAYAVEKQDLTVIAGCSQTTNNVEISYGAKPTVAVNEIISLNNASGKVEWVFDPVESQCTGVTATTAQCFGMTVTIPSGTVLSSLTAAITGAPASTDQGKEGFFTLKVTQESPFLECKRRYRLHVVKPTDLGGWGDPHMTTADDVHYDFQGAGEFTALRQDRFEVQTRQTPVPTASIPGANAHTGLAVCVSIYTAVAARIGSNRVTYQPNLSPPGLFGQADPSGMQLRVNGQLATLTDRGIDLVPTGGGGGSVVEGRILPVAGGGIEITDVRGTQLVATPAFWTSQQKWYLNLNVYQASAIHGIWGLLAEGRWLPALPDGTSLGSRPESEKERYQQLYKTFADAWRVTAATSLFDYAPGTNTSTFTLDEWPRYNPQSCAIEGQNSVQPTTPQAAEQACSAVTNPAQKADCIFDVTVTGETGFARSYEAMQRFRPHGAGFQPVLSAGPPLPPSSGWPRWLWILILILLLILALMFFLRKKAV